MPISIREIEWGEAAEQGLKVAAGDDMEIIKAEVLGGISKLWKCDSESSAAYMVTRLDDKTELCIVAGEGQGFFEFMPVFVQWCRQKGYSVRTHVKRKGLVKMWARLGITFDEYVLRG